MKLLVTGASGFVGRRVCEIFVRRGDAVLGSWHTRYEPLAGVEWLRLLNIAEDEGWRSALKGVDAVVHLAARVHVMNDTAIDPLVEFRKVNVHATVLLARQAAVAGVKRFVYVSSAKVNGESTLPGHAFTELDLPNPQDAYGQSKCEAETGLRAIAAQTGMEAVIIRPPLVYGPGVKANFAALMRVVQRGWPLPLGAVHNLRSLVALDNLVDFLAICTTHPLAANQTFLVSDGHDISTPELVRGLANALQAPIRLLSVPPGLLEVVAALIGKGAAARRLCGNLQVDISKARSMLQWVPPLTVQEGLLRAVQPVQ